MNVARAPTVLFMIIFAFVMRVSRKTSAWTTTQPGKQSAHGHVFRANISNHRPN